MPREAPSLRTFQVRLAINSSLSEIPEYERERCGLPPVMNAAYVEVRGEAEAVRGVRRALEESLLAGRLPSTLRLVTTDGVPYGEERFYVLLPVEAIGQCDPNNLTPQEVDASRIGIYVELMNSFLPQQKINYKDLMETGDMPGFMKASEAMRELVASHVPGRHTDGPTRSSAVR